MSRTRVDNHDRKEIVAERLCELLRNNNIQESVLAKKLGVDPKSVRSWLNKDTLLSPDKAIAICEAYGVSMDWLYGISNEKNITASDFTSKFVFDIRDFVKIAKNDDGTSCIVITFDDGFLEHLNKRHEIESSDIIPHNAAEDQLASLDYDYVKKSDDFVWEFRIPEKDFTKKLYFDGKCITYLENEVKHKIIEGDIIKKSAFLRSFLGNDESE